MMIRISSSDVGEDGILDVFTEKLKVWAEWYGKKESKHSSSVLGVGEITGLEVTANVGAAVAAMYGGACVRSEEPTPTKSYLLIQSGRAVFTVIPPIYSCGGSGSF